MKSISRTVLALLCSICVISYQSAQSGTINSPHCNCCPGGATDVLADFDHHCPPAMDAEIKVTFSPLDSTPVSFYLNIANAESGSFVTDTFDTYTVPVTFPYCIYSDSCYTVSWWSPDSSNVSVIVELDNELVDFTGWGAHEATTGYACCEDFSLTLLGTSADCDGTPTGTASAQVDGGKAPHNYEWTKPADPAFLITHQTELTNLSPGMYFLKVTDDVGCEVEDNIMIVEEAALLVVSSTEDSGDNTLRKAVGCAEYGDTITFDLILSGEPIVLTTGPIEVEGTVTWRAHPIDDIAVDASLLDMAIRVETGAELHLEGLQITGGYDSAILVDQGGILRIMNTVNIKKE